MGGKTRILEAMMDGSERPESKMSDKRRVEKRQKSKTRGMQLKMRKNSGKLSLRREDSSYKL